MRLKLDPAGELSRRLRKIAPERADGDGILVLSPDRDFCMREADRARSSDFEIGNWPQAQFLWPLHPIFDWIEDRSTMQLFGRNEAPLVHVDALGTNQTLFLVQGIYPNRKSSPVVDEWFGLLFEGSAFEREFTLDESIKLTGIDDAGIPNRRLLTQQDADRAESLCVDAVDAARIRMSSSYNSYKESIDPQINEEIDKLNDLRERHKLVQMTLPGFESGRTRKLREIDDLFDHYVDWVSDTLEIEDNPNIRIQATFVGA